VAISAEVPPDSMRQVAAHTATCVLVKQVNLRTSKASKLSTRRLAYSVWLFVPEVLP
jgi:hypothetical protein